MSQGQEGELRQFRRLRKTDYYEAKASEEYKNPTSWPVCENCGIEITGKSYRGSSSDRRICQRCWNETV